MDNESLKTLAAEREARLKSCVHASSSAPPAARPRSTAAAPSAPAAKPVSSTAPPFASLHSAARAAPASSLAKAHRSIRIAHSIALALEGLCLLSLLVIGFGSTTVFVMLLAVGLARSGGGALHGMLPAMLREGQPPSPAEVGAAAELGLFGKGGFASPGAALADECSVFVENLAFGCTYGKTNCLTNQMYTGELSLGKIFSLVGGKLVEGILRC
ncbi:hypothetical protein T492DRAFT_964811 [Pavlovales sp. CCMP2436]|nr:hypothetical protein T492DRAFT_964811 [Pavlovales sp. CCMP2436]|mmetsp:Transcript_22550/g.57231  ORF Transcript_22550/g.57231 Transcript_22550/m.57231 type:complete len:215 (-) Transcript_22550:269-913(-)